MVGSVSGVRSSGSARAVGGVLQGALGGREDGDKLKQVRSSKPECFHGSNKPPGELEVWRLMARGGHHPEWVERSQGDGVSRSWRRWGA